MKKSISILLVALLLALGLALPPAEPASANGGACIDVTMTAHPDSVIAGDTVTFAICMSNCGDVPLVIEDINSDLPVLPPVPFPYTLNPGDILCWESSYDTQPEDVGLLEACLDIDITLPTGEQVTLTVCAEVEVLPPPFIEVLVDIKPGSFPNSLNVKSKGVLPVAILGTDDFDVMQINPETVRLSWDGISGIPGLLPLRWAWEDINGDGVMDIVLKYNTEALRPLTMTHEPPGDLTMMLTGNLKAEYSGTPIAGEDTVRIINKGYDGP